MRPLDKSMSLSLMSYIMISPCIIILIRSSNPPTIIRIIIAINVDTVYRKSIIIAVV